MAKPIRYTAEQLDYVKSNCTLERKELTKRFNEKFNTNISIDNISGLCKRNKWKTGRTGCFEKGSVPPNKGTKGLTGANRTSFKKGQYPWNKEPIGYERIDKKDGYIHIKIAEPNIFALKHRHIWEKHFGPVPDKHVIAFKNQDKSDCRIENLILMKKSEMVRYSQSFHKLANPITNETCLIMAKVKTKACQLKKEDVQNG
ncbi:HNH endonuclease [Acinetobacter sp. AOR18_HL]|uniref:HNH endonuclease signature motif containing protein n=1 Tax=Acinetobacter sp. AOR18_HL TaxID=2919381 RepID=UPI0022EB806E|nr:HNH endonuclease signature motif containing protein [Acinetobacter sp. AOR18_HL]MDA3542521.1 HNH endonuclease [Acinetobacter sp. AOR18_HL]